MKKFLLLILLSVQPLLWSGQAQASPVSCATDTLKSYAMLGSTGCTIGSVTFSDFVLRSPAAGAINSPSIIVTPVMMGSTIVGVTFGVSPTASGGVYYDNLIGYRISGMGSTINGATVVFAGSSATGDAAVSVDENLCLAGTFGADGVSGCSGKFVDLSVLNSGLDPDPVVSQASAAFAAVTALSVATDIAYDSGSGEVEGSSSTLASASNFFNVTAAPLVVPEPSVAALFAAAACAVALVRRRRTARA